MILRSAHSRHHHRLRFEKATQGVMTGQTVYHWRCRDCNWPFWCFKWELWNTEPVELEF